MAYDKVVDSAQLDSDLTSVANAIRSKGGSTAQLAFPSGFVSAINAISTGGGTTVIEDFTQMATDTYNAPSSDTLLSNSIKIECGFKPRVFALFIQGALEQDNNTNYKVVSSVLITDVSGNKLYAGTNFAYKISSTNSGCRTGYSDNDKNILYAYDNGVYFGNGANVYIKGGATYKWFALR